MTNTHARAVHQPWPGLINAYRDRLPIGEGWTPITLLEGGTPLIHAARISEMTGCTVHLKVEGLNPTGSFKDRGMTMAVTESVARGQQAVLCARILLCPTVKVWISRWISSHAMVPPTSS